MNKIQSVLFTVAFTVLGVTYSQVQNLEVTSLFNDKVTLKIPKGFTVMSQEMLKVKYPSDRRPSIVFTNPSGTINIAINKTSNPASPNQIAAIEENYVQTFKSFYPSAKWIDNGVLTVDDKQIGFIELITPAVDTEIYNLMFFTDLNGQLLLGTFNCTEPNMENWSSTAKVIMNSLKIK